MRDATPSAAGPTRRLVAVGALGAMAVTLAGCGIRLEDDAPSIPLVPKREPISAEAALLHLLAAVQSASVAPLVTSDPIAPLLPTIHARQATVLHDALRQRGVPEEELPSTPTPASPTPTPPGTATAPGPSTSPTASASAAPRPRTVAEVEASILAASEGLAGAEAELRPTLVSLLGQVRAASELGAGSPVEAARPSPRASISASPGTSPSPSSSGTSTGPTATPAPAPSASPEWSNTEGLATLVTASRRATFLLEVAAARSPRKVRDAWLADVTALHVLTADLVEAAGDAAPAPDLGQSLPRPVTTPAEAATLATEAVGTLLAAFGAALRGLTDPDPVASFSSVPRWIGSVAAVGHRHGLPLTAFPGLT